MPVGLEASGAVVYKLSPNPKNMGESYVLPKGFPGSFLPEPPEGLMWLKTGESGISQNFELIKAYEGLNPSILSRYVKALIVEMGNATSEAEVGTKIEEFLKRLPFKVNPERQAALIENFKTGNAENFLPLIMREQQVSFLAEWEEARGTQNAVLFCKNIFLK